MSSFVRLSTYNVEIITINRNNKGILKVIVFAKPNSAVSMFFNNEFGVITKYRFLFKTNIIRTSSGT